MHTGKLRAVRLANYGVQTTNDLGLVARGRRVQASCPSTPNDVRVRQSIAHLSTIGFQNSDSCSPSWSGSTGF